MLIVDWTTVINNDSTSVVAIIEKDHNTDLPFVIFIVEWILITLIVASFNTENVVVQ